MPPASIDGQLMRVADEHELARTASTCASSWSKCGCRACSPRRHEDGARARAASAAEQCVDAGGAMPAALAASSWAALRAMRAAAHGHARLLPRPRGRRRARWSCRCPRDADDDGDAVAAAVSRSHHDALFAGEVRVVGRARAVVAPPSRARGRRRGAPRDLSTAARSVSSSSDGRVARLASRPRAEQGTRSGCAGTRRRRARARDSSAVGLPLRSAPAARRGALKDDAARVSPSEPASAANTLGPVGCLGRRRGATTARFGLRQTQPRGT